ncbi:hypothetical protein OG920_44320 [Streptomyces europaeiscabiei]|uniref:hypothetical protein n=1 Tax=Streptomyces europaeiscabiei TaxID=146819 RepID=UPI0030E126BF
MFATGVTVWNGDTAKQSSTISPDFPVRAALLDGTDGSSIRGVEGLVDQIRCRCSPTCGSAWRSAHWSTAATCPLAGWPPGPTRGGFPGAKAAPGTVITYAGTDTLRVEHGKFVEYWFNADTLSLLQPLQAI